MLVYRHVVSFTIFESNVKSLINVIPFKNLPLKSANRVELPLLSKYAYLQFEP